ncbi:MAG: MarR family transcriptional regulator [Acidimicrobiales bacterium]
MTNADRSRLAVLHGLRVKGFAEPPALAELAGLGESQVSGQLDLLSVAGLVAHRQGVIGGWHLTPAGRAEHATALAAAMPDEAVTARVRAGYERFVAIDPAVKAVCTAWQIRDLDAGVVNDHSDADYDAGVVARLGTIHVDAVGTIDALAAATARFGPYRHRLDAAYGRVRAGDSDALTKPLSGSYHDVWMELHEDLLVTLGLERSGS